MSKVKEPEKQQEQPVESAQETIAPEAGETDRAMDTAQGETAVQADGAKKKKAKEPKESRPPMDPKKKKKLIRGGIAGGAVLLVIVALVKLLGSSEPEVQVVEDVVTYNSITSSVQGSGITKAKNSETITLTTSGTVQDVFVTEGQQVTAGTALFTIDSEAARTAVEKARQDVDGYAKELRTMERDIAGLNLSAGYPGKLLETVTLNPGDLISKGTKVATLADDTRMRLEQYYSYAYAGDIRAGQTVSVSVPALMSSLEGRVEDLHMVNRITPEGSQLFSAEIIVDNPGSLTAEMVASAIITVGGETVYPYEAGKLEYYRTGPLESTVNGTVISSNLVDYLQVSAGQVLVQIDGDESEAELFSKQQALADAEKALENALKNLENCNAVAPIDGTVMGLALTPGAEVAANTTVISIADTTTVLVDATVDERNIAYVQAGMMVDLDQWGTPFMGTVESVSLNSKVENGVAAYPMVITVDNMEGNLMTGSNVTYTLITSQNDNCLTLPIQSVKNAQMMDGSSGYVVFVKANRAPDNMVELAMPVEGVPEGYYPVQVEIGISDNYNVEIKSGVEEGTSVFTTTRSENSYGW